MAKKIPPCWNCGKKTMEPLPDGWFKCSSCGATWCPHGKPKPFIDIRIESNGTSDRKIYRPFLSTGRKIPPLSDREKKAKAKARHAGQPIY